MIAITIENLTKKFGSTVALDGIGCRIEPGELFFLLGPSGCGKTTLLRVLAGFCSPDAGRIVFGDEDVTRVPPHRRNTGMVFQSYALWPHLTVAGNVAFGLEERKVRAAEIKDRVAAALAAVQMADFAERKVTQLSGGQQQRVALARALVVRPRCLLLDEPLSNLDARLRIEMRAEIRRVCKEGGLTAIYVTHDQKEALAMADRMAVLEAGRIAQVGTPEDVYRRPRTKAVADFIGETNFLPGRVRSATARRTIVETPGGAVFDALIGDPNWLPRRGEEATLSIRPESWTLSEKPADKNAIKGRLGDSSYLGEIAQHQFSGEAGTIKIFELNPRLATRPKDRDFYALANLEDVVALRNPSGTDRSSRSLTGSQNF